jgi:hypothetical protein
MVLPRESDPRLRDAADEDHVPKLTPTPQLYAELRVHGVSATPPEVMLASPELQSPSPVRVAGDALSGFYRREYPYSRPWDRVEAYSWSGLTSGGGLRALWLLLTPFLLVNAAFWASPVPLVNYDLRPDADVTAAATAGVDPPVVSPTDPAAATNRMQAIRFISALLQRMFALSLTATFVLGAVTAAMDVVGWQYLRGGGNHAFWLSFLNWPVLQSPKAQFLVTAAAPLAIVCVLWVLAFSTWRSLESVNGTNVPHHQLITPLEDRRMWNGRGPVAKLRSVHISFALALIGLSVLSPLLPTVTNKITLGGMMTDAWGWITLVVAALLAALVLLLIVLVWLPGMSERPKLPGSADPTPVTPTFYKWLPWVTLGLLTGAGVVFMLSVQDIKNPNSGSMPDIDNAIPILFGIQAVLIFLIAVATVTLRFAVDSGTPEVPPGGELPKQARAWFGMTPVVLITLGWLLAGAWSAAATMFVVKAAGGHVVSSAVKAGKKIADPVFVPSAYIWGAAASAVVLAFVGALLVATVFGAWLVQRSKRRAVLAAYAGTEGEPTMPLDAKRSGAIQWDFVMGRIPDFADIVVFVVACSMWIVVVLGIIGFVLDPALVSTYSWLYQLGSIGILGVGVLSFLIGRLAFTNSNDRKKIGILWDVGTFWPRATHPLAPPCYGERAVPDLRGRIEYYRAHDKGDHHDDEDVPYGLPVVLSCHSQGSIIGATAILQMRFDDSCDVRFLTYGSPLTRLYARYFPGYFGIETLSRVGALISTDAGERDGVVPNTDTMETWRWRNLWRPTDPVGGAIFVRHDTYQAYAGDINSPIDTASPGVDWKIRDPARFSRKPSDAGYAAANGHSNYPLDPAYQPAVDTLLTFRETTP